jgi:hypothetical protein
MHRRRALVVVLAALLGLFLAPLFGGGNSGTARAQTGTTTCQYPFDNCTTTTVPQNTTTTRHGPPTSHPGPPTSRPGRTTTTTQGNQPILVLILDLSSARPGTEIAVVVCGAPPGVHVRITFDGNVVQDIVVGSGSCQIPQALRSRGGRVLAVSGPLGRALNVRLQSSSGAGTGHFTVPNVGSGQHLVCAESAGMTSSCKEFKVADDASVLGTSFTNGGAPLVSSSDPNSFLAFSGMGLLRLLLLAGVLIALGLYLVRRGQHRDGHPGSRHLGRA